MVSHLDPFSHRSVGAARFLALLALVLGLLVWASVGHAAPSPFGVAIPDTTGPVATEGLWGAIQQWILARQSDFYLALKDTVKLVEQSPWALFSLLALSFAYGAFHAAGPGHGKVVLTTYLFASGATARKGALLAMIAAMVQASVAVILIGIAAVVLNLTSMVITRTAQLLELASYAMFVVLGLWLLLRAYRAFRSARAIQTQVNGDGAASHHDHGAHDHHHHDHGHDDHSHDDHSHDDHHHHDGSCSCGHSHAPDVDLVEEAKGARGLMLAVISMGLRPCSGALIVLVFALSQKVFWAGVLSAYAMGLGTGMTISILALTAVYARSFSQRLVAQGISGGIMRWFSSLILFLAGLVVMGFGLLLLLANLL